MEPVTRIEASAFDGSHPFDLKYPRDTLAHSSIQQHSAGDVFPAVIARIEQGGEYAGHELTIGAFRETYGSYDDAHMVAAWVTRDGKIIPERYAQLVPGAGRSMAAFGADRE